MGCLPPPGEWALTFGIYVQAYGSEGLGILTVSGVPGYPDMRQRLLPLAAKFADLPDEIKLRYEDIESLYNFGWSHGRESLENGQPDRNKGSYYANPIIDEPAGIDMNLIRNYPAYCRPNIWPSEDLPDLEKVFKDLGTVMIRVGRLLARHCDQYARTKYPDVMSLETIIKESPCPKGRLLHYFSPTHPEGSDAAERTSWCGWHTDHGSLTGLTAALYLDSNYNEVVSPDPDAGIYIKSRSGEVVRVVIPPHHLAFQMGECSSIFSGGVLRATPHCVVAPRMELCHGVTRNTFAVFMQPKWDIRMDIPSGVDPKEVGVGQWKRGQTFGEFTKKTLENYYSSSGKVLF